MKQTTNYNLVKPELTDSPPDITVMNQNWDTIDIEIANKVDKVANKQLSTEDYTSTEKAKLAGIAVGANNYTHPTTAGNKHIPSGGANGQFLKYSSSGTVVWVTPATGDIQNLNNILEGKVDKVTNKQLSTEDYTSTEKAKLVGIEDNANKYVHPGSGTNPHGTTKSDIGLGSVQNYGVATQTEAEAGNVDNKYMTPLKVFQAIAKSSETIDLPLVNGWQNEDESTYGKATATKIGNIIFLNGYISNGTKTQGTNIVSGLPASFRPSGQKILYVPNTDLTNTGLGRLSMWLTGDLKISIKDLAYNRLVLDGLFYKI